MKILSILPWADWLVLVFFAMMWIGYAQFASRWSLQRPSILAATNRFRLRWIKVSLSRDPRVLDGIITQTLSNTPAFFSSTTILIMGGLLALMGTTDKAAELVGVGALAGALASLVALAVGWGLARHVFEFAWTPPIWVPLVGTLAGALLALLAGWWGLREILRRPVVQTLRQAAM